MVNDFRAPANGGSVRLRSRRRMMTQNGQGKQRAEQKSGEPKRKPSKIRIRALTDGLRPDEFIFGIFFLVPLILAAPILLGLVSVGLLGLLILGLMGVIVVVVATLPMNYVLAVRPKVHLAGYRELLSNETKARIVNGNGSMIKELLGMIILSDFAYIYADFRKLSILGKVPIEFKYLSLESDEMSQWDIINGETHKLKAFDSEGEFGAGMRPSVLIVTVLRFLAHEAMEQRIENINSLSRRNLLNSSLVSGSKHKKDDTWDRFVMYENLFTESLLDTSYTCNQHSLGGTLCSCSGLHGMQCFLDALVREAEKGDKSCESLIGILSDDDAIDSSTFDSEAARISELLHAVTVSGNIFKKHSILHTTFIGMNANDSRIVWTNDRAGDAECVYIIAVSRSKRRVTVIFRGTATLSDVLKDADSSPAVKPNPISEDYPDKDEIILNNGFAEYLFKKRHDTGKTKYDEIAQRVHEFGQELGTYSVYVSGHSMGGALATLFGFYASTDNKFAQPNNPVRVFTFAGVMAGRICFCKAFQHQEKVGLLQHLRVTNDNDVIPLGRPRDLIPIIHPPVGDFAYGHTGLSLVLHEGGAVPSIKYWPDMDWWGTLTANIRTNPWFVVPLFKAGNVGKYHGLAEYAQRIELSQAKMIDAGLGRVSLNDLYDMHGITAQKTY